MSTVTDHKSITTTQMMTRNKTKRKIIGNPCMMSRLLLAVAGSAALCDADTNSKFCPRLYHKGVLELDVNPAKLNVDDYSTEEGTKRQSLAISSFLNYKFTLSNGVYAAIEPPFAPDQVGRIAKIGDIEPADFDFATHYQKLTDSYGTIPKTTWPNNAKRVPDGVLPFEGVIIPQGFHPLPTAGRLTIVDVASLQEYIVHEGTLASGAPSSGPRFFHDVLFFDMDGDGKLDIVTARSGFKILPNHEGPPTVYPPFSELVYYKNPGNALQPDIRWEEVIIYGGPLAEPPFMGPDIHLAMHDFDGDGNPAIIATHFFSGDDTSLLMPTKGKIVMYGAPSGRRWSDVNGTDASAQPRVKLIDDSQGFPLSIDIVDLNGDGKMEILATNHQPNCMPFPATPGRVYALVQPESGNIFEDDWTVRVLLDRILSQPTPAGARAIRLAPGHAFPFHPKDTAAKSSKRPWILASGDQAGKVWMMKPKGDEFDYESAVVFDINDYYGEGTTQMYTSDGFTISTIGEPALFYDESCIKTIEKKDVSNITIKSGKSSFTKHVSISKGIESYHMSPSQGAKHWSKSNKGIKRLTGETSLNRDISQTPQRKCCVSVIFIPVFEAKQIHVLSFVGRDEKERITCPADVTYGCTSPRT